MTRKDRWGLSQQNFSCSCILYHKLSLPIQLYSTLLPTHPAQSKVWDIFTTAHLDQIQRKMTTGLLPSDNVSSLGLSRSTSVGTESVLGAPASGTTGADNGINKSEFINMVVQVSFLSRFLSLLSNRDHDMFCCKIQGRMSG